MIRIVIDISKHVYEHAKERTEDSNDEWDAMRAIANGTLLSHPKIGRWVLAQRDKYIDINCSECGNTRIKEYAYGYTIDELDLNEINNLIAKNRMNYCECCGAKMEIKQGE